MLDCQLLETALLNIIGFQTLVATKTARVVQAAQGRPVAEFGLRRAQGPDGGVAVARASYVAGCASTSNVLAGRRYGIPVSGTHAHSWVLSFPQPSWRRSARSPRARPRTALCSWTPTTCARAWKTPSPSPARWRRKVSACPASASIRAISPSFPPTRGAALEEGLSYVKIVVSNDLDEHTITSLFNQRAPVDAFGVGTKLATCYDQPALGCVYKLSARRGGANEPWTPVMKFSEQPFKRTIPGMQQVRRYMDTAGAPVCDMIYDPDHLMGEGERRGHTLVAVNDAALVTDVSEFSYRELLVPQVRNGAAASPREDIEVARARCASALASLDDVYKRFLYPQSYVVGMEAGLAAVRDELVRERMAATSSVLPWKAK